MKKYLFVFLILLLLTGCNVQNSHSHTQCPECGKCIAEDCDEAEELKCSGHQHHIYKLTIIDENNFIYDKPAETSCESDTKIVMHSHPLIDADLAMYINGEFHSIQNTIIVNDEYVWEYSFIMPERDTTIEFKTQALEYFSVKTILDIPSLTREDILRITVNSVNLSNTPKPNPIPGSLRVVFSSTDYEDITYMLGFLNANVVEDRSDNWQDNTGNCNKYSIYTIDKKYDFEIINGYITVNNKHYKLLGYEPSINYVAITCAFNTNLDSYEAYTLDGTKIGDFNGLSEFEFYEIKAPLTGVDDYGYLETEFGRIYIHDSKTFYIKDGENYTYYKLAWEKEKDFSDICGYGLELQVPTNHFLRNQLGCEWLNEIKVDDINEIKIITENVGVAPGVLKNIASSIDKTVISKIYENCYWLDTTPISKEEGQIDGGGATTIRFILNDSTVKEIYINNGNYKDPNADYYKLLYIPKFSENDEYENSYGFVTYQDKAEVYWNDTFICEIPMSEIEFVEVDSYVTTEGGIVGEWVLKTEFGELCFPESHIFHFEDNSKTIYKLIGMRLFKLVEKYSNWWVSQNGQPVLLD